MFQDGIWGIKFYWENYDIQSSDNALDNSKYITHALKNEVIKIQWCTTSLLKQASCEQEIQLEIIQRSSRHLENFIKRINLLSRELYQYPHTFYIYPVLERCIQDLKAIAPDTVTFSLLCKKDDRIYTDYEHLIEMLHNLLNNALEVCNEYGCITVSYNIHPIKRCCILTVEDNGSGIAKEACRKLFQPYYTTKSSASGHLGLGLPYCYHVMEMQGGGIRVKSIETQGSTFFLYFPYHKSKYNALADITFCTYQKLQNEEN